MVYSLYQLVSYVVLALLLFAVAGVNGIALLAGGTFAGLVVGLAGQTVLSNLIAGVMLLFVRPFGPGDRITLTTWQYSLIAPVYPPKFYSNDLLVPGYTGIVEELGLIYSRIRQDDGIRVRFPNNVLIQAAILSHDVAERWVRVKYEIPPAIDPEQLISRAEEMVRTSDWVARPDSVRVWVHQATIGSYVISV
ncbi:MscS mechanosensitive ion channel, partial [mine drainage metagenome]